MVEMPEHVAVGGIDVKTNLRKGRHSLFAREWECAAARDSNVDGERGERTMPRLLPKCNAVAWWKPASVEGEPEQRGAVLPLGDLDGGGEGFGGVRSIDREVSECEAAYCRLLAGR
jgi:hypothetical protein